MLIQFPENKINTPLGVLECKFDKDSDFPNIKIILDGILVTMVEYNPSQDNILTVTYNNEDDEPTSINSFF